MKTYRCQWATALFAVSILIAAGLPARGDTILYQTGFEAPTFQAGSPLNGQGGFIGFLNENAAMVSTEFPRSGSQAVKVDGALMEPFLFGSVDGDYYPGYFDYDAIAHGTPIVYASIDVALVAAANVESAAGLEATGDLGAVIRLESDGLNGFVSAWSPDEYIVGPAISFGRYYTLGLRLDYGARTADYFIDGTRFASLTLAANTGNVLSTMEMLMGGDYPLASVGYFDNYEVSAAVPEPGTFALLGMGMLTVLGYARARHRPDRE